MNLFRLSPALCFALQNGCEQFPCSLSFVEPYTSRQSIDDSFFREEIDFLSDTMFLILENEPKERRWRERPLSKTDRRKQKD